MEFSKRRIIDSEVIQLLNDFKKKSELLERVKIKNFYFSNFLDELVEEGYEVHEVPDYSNDSDAESETLYASFEECQIYDNTGQIDLSDTTSVVRRSSKKKFEVKFPNLNPSDWKDSFKSVI